MDAMSTPLLRLISNTVQSVITEIHFFLMAANGAA